MFRFMHFRTADRQTASAPDEQTALAPGEQTLERHVTLDGSMLARLINMRFEKASSCACERCTDLISKLHINNSSLAKEHNNEIWGVKYWANLAGAPTFGYTTENASDKLRQVDDHESFTDGLMAAEREWQRAQTTVCSHEDSDDFWIKQYAHVKSHCATLREQLETRDAQLASALDQANEGADAEVDTSLVEKVIARIGRSI